MSTGPSDPVAVVRALFTDHGRDAEGRYLLDHVDELMAEDFVNHAAGPQGRDGWKSILATIEADLGPLDVEHHHFVAEGDLVAHHVTIHGTHRGSTMPLLTGRPVTNRPISWTFMHLWRVSDGRVVEHWACRDDVGLLAQIDHAR